MSDDLHKLPACERCRKRKVKCNGLAPKCSPCQKSGSSCIIIDLATHERYSRSAIADIEDEINSLEQGLATRQTTSPALIERTHIHDDHLYEEERNTNPHENFETQQPEREHRVLSIVGSNVLSPGAESILHDLPSFEIAQAMLQKYFSTSHLHHPIISRATVFRSVSKVYNRIHELPTHQDHYMVFMLLAVSSVTMYRKGQINLHPYGYFYAAQRFMPLIQLVGSITAIQNLLIFARFAMYYHVNYSIWDITRICMRQCIELGLHQKPIMSLMPMDEQTQRNVFWDTFVHDRYSSGILGRPYAISEEEIDVSLPLEASEADISSSTATSLDHIDVSSIHRPNESSVALYVIGLRQITTQVHRQFSSSTATSPQTIVGAGQILSEMQDLVEEFDTWLETSPKFENPQSLYQRPEWYQFLMEKDKLVLLRSALARVPVSGLTPPRSLLRRYLACATAVVELYDTLYRQNYITWTRSYFQIIFTCGLSIIYALSVLTPGSNSDLVDKSDNDIIRAGQTTLITVRDLLHLLVQEMPDVERFISILDSLMKPYISRTVTRAGSEVGPGQMMAERQGYVMPSGVESKIPHQTQELAGIANNRHQIPKLNQPVDGRFQSSLQISQAQSLDFNIGIEMADLQQWPQSMGNDNVFGQLEAGLGEYAWGYLVDDNAWGQYLPNLYEE